MEATLKERPGRGAAVGWLAASALALAFVAAAPAAAQTVYEAPFGPAGSAVAEDRMLLEADELVYDVDNEIVSAVGNVRIYYQLNTLEADRVVYDQRASTVAASGNVRMHQPDGNVVYADYLKLSDDFRDGFVDQLMLIAPDQSRVVAARADRQDGDTTVFSRGAYTPCLPCLEDPAKPPTWQIKAARVIHDSNEKMVYYEDVSFEFFGLPIAYFPVFSHPDPTVKRKSGFLMPTPMTSGALGFGVRVPYFWALAPNYDLTLTATPNTKQGFLSEAEWRHRLENGTYRVRLSGAYQRDPGAFAGKPGDEHFRGSIDTSGQFRINEYWQWGWQGAYASDSTFMRTYRLIGSDDVTSELFLTGLSARNHFDARVVYYQRMDETEFTDRLPIVHPVLDYEYILGRPVFGGTLSFDANLTSLSRDEADLVALDAGQCAGAAVTDCRFVGGYAGYSTKFVASAQWERRMIGPLGQVFTPHLSARGDVYAYEIKDPLANFAPAALATTGIVNPYAIGDEMLARGMITAGLDWRWPFISTHEWGSQMFEPIVQVAIRPDAQGNNRIPNEDAQSIVLHESNLFAWDKFSGYDRMEGGSRVNAGLQYTLRFHSGGSIRALFGQSYHIAGDNPFPARSGLETDVSDYVAALYFSPTTRLTFGGRALFDNHDFTLNRFEARSSFGAGPVSGAAGFGYVKARPELGFPDRRIEATASARIRIDENWSLSGSGRYDIQRGRWVSNALGLTWEDDCFSLTVAYEQTYTRVGDLEDDQRVMLYLTLKTLGDFSVNPGLVN